MQFIFTPHRMSHDSRVTECSDVTIIYSQSYTWHTKRVKVSIIFQRVHNRYRHVGKHTNTFTVLYSAKPHIAFSARQCLCLCLYVRRGIWKDCHRQRSPRCFDIDWYKFSDIPDVGQAIRFIDAINRFWGFLELSNVCRHTYAIAQSIDHTK